MTSRLQDFKTSRSKTNLRLNLRNLREKYSFAIGVPPDSYRDRSCWFHLFIFI